MKISDEISLSARNLLRRKGRTALTLVGVVIGTCMVVLMISLGIAQTKTLAKLANHAAKQWPRQTGGGVDLSCPRRQRRQAAVSGRRGHRQHQADPPCGGGHALRAGV